jgi:tetratricopeptide (TPR) repeat protein
MDEHRVQAYLDLINQLLSCPDGQEEILQAHRELLDPDLLQVMMQVAAQLQQQENETNAAWLQNLAMQLVEAMGLTSNAQPESEAASQDSRQFFGEILQCIAQNQGAAEPLYQFLAANQTKLNPGLLSTLPEATSALFANFPEEQHPYLAVVIGTFADLIQQFPLGQRAINIKLAIAAYEQSLQVMTREAMPVDWAASMMNLASAYRIRIRGDRAQNIEDAIAAYEQSLQVRTREAMPVEWAQSMNNLALAYADRIRGDRAQNIEDAIAAYEQSLQVMTREAMPVDWAASMMNLASAYRIRIRGDRAQNIEDAIAAYEQSLQVTTREAMPVEWATSMMNLASAYHTRIRGDRAQNLEDAIAAYEQSLQVMTREAMPVEWAVSMMNLASTYRIRIRGDRAQNIEDAIAAYEQSLEIFKPELLPADCRRTARLLGNLYADNQRWANALAPYATALEAAELLYQASFTRGGQEAELSETNDLFRRAAYAQARSGNLEKAVVTAEVGRARGLSERLERDRADLTALEKEAPALYQQYQQAIDNLRQLEVEERSSLSPTVDNRPASAEADLAQRAKTTRQGLNAAILAIRQVPGYESFLDQPNFDDVAAAVQPRPLAKSKVCYFSGLSQPLL